MTCGDFSETGFQPWQQKHHHSSLSFQFNFFSLFFPLMNSIRQNKEYRCKIIISDAHFSLIRFIISMGIIRGNRSKQLERTNNSAPIRGSSLLPLSLDTYTYEQERKTISVRLYHKEYVFSSFSLIKTIYSSFVYETWDCSQMAPYLSISLIYKKLPLLI